jgi:hypothetical protein
VQRFQRLQLKNERKYVMAGQRKVVYDLQMILNEIRTREGIPENLSTEAQLWDEILKKETAQMPEQLLPLIREVYGKSYPRDVDIYPLGTEYSVERMDTGEIASVRADITIQIAGRDIYHFECESKKDGTLVMRMFEYDVHIAISYAEQDSDGGYHIRFPRSAVLYLQNLQPMPDTLSGTVAFQDGTIHEYQIPVIHVQSYSLEEIKRKHLSVLIPFLPLRYRERFPGPESKESIEDKIQRGELTDFYHQIILLLEEEVKGGYLTESNRKMILFLLSKSYIRVFYKSDALMQEVIDMTAPILELEYEKNERLEKELAELKESNQKELAELKENSRKKLAEKEAELARLKAELEKYRG